MFNQKKKKIAALEQEVRDLVDENRKTLIELISLQDKARGHESAIHNLSDCVSIDGQIKKLQQVTGTTSLYVLVDYRPEW